MHIISWNVNGLRSILRKNFAHFVNEFHPEILCLQETRVDDGVAPSLPCDRYKHVYFHHCQSRKGYSGTAVLSEVECLHVDNVNVDSAFEEGRVIVAEYPDFYLVNTYVPNSQTGLVRLPYRHRVWDVAFRHYLINLQKKKPLVVCGDFNVAHMPIDLEHPESNHFNPGFTDEERNNFSRLLEEVQLVDIFRHLHPGQPRHYTWWSYRTRAWERNVGWRIDYFLISKPLLSRVKDCTILKNVLGSDHAPILLEIDGALSS